MNFKKRLQSRTKKSLIFIHIRYYITIKKFFCTSEIIFHKSFISNFRFNEQANIYILKKKLFKSVYLLHLLIIDLQLKSIIKIYYMCLTVYVSMHIAKICLRFRACSYKHHLKWMNRSLRRESLFFLVSNMKSFILFLIFEILHKKFEDDKFLC